MAKKCWHIVADFDRTHPKFGRGVVTGSYAVFGGEDPNFGYGEWTIVHSARCIMCKATLSLGPSNDEPEAVRVEMLAADRQPQDPRPNPARDGRGGAGGGEVKERPILFSAPMVRAILDDRKTQTRRTVSGANLDALSRLESELGKPTSSDEWGVCFDNDGIGGVVSVPLPCKHGAIGDRLWVRETWRMSAGRSQEPIYAADLGDYDRDEKGPWRPSIFMPRKLSRITLEITAVRVQRLQEIGADDVVAEGLGPDDIRCDGECGATPCALAVPAFKRLWDLINGRDGRRWSDNPFVWALSFRRVETK